MLEILPLGGIGEVGMNCTLFRYGDDAVLVDCGIYFPNMNHYGIEFAFPDFSILREKNIKLSAVVITHAHEDHIGSLPFLTKNFNVPIYASKFTQLVLKRKELDRKNIHSFVAKKSFRIGSFEFKAFPMSHSILEAHSLGIICGGTKLFWSGDFKDDPSPPYSWKTDWDAIEKFSEDGVDLLFSDSTNSLVQGASRSEKEVEENLSETIINAEGRVFVTCFSSHLERIKMVFEAARKCGRKVVTMGRSMNFMVEVGLDYELLKDLNSLLLDKYKASSYGDNELVILCSGTQGEYKSALNRIVSGNDKVFKLRETDTVVLSSSIIPGNELSCFGLINRIHENEASIVTAKHKYIHASGHASKEDQAKLINKVKPEYFIPIHGDRQLLEAHRKTALECGVDEYNSFIIKNGDLVKLKDDGALALERDAFAVRSLNYDQNLNSPVSDEVLRQRKKMAFAGSITILLNITGTKKRLKLLSRGLFSGEDKEKFHKELLSVISDELMWLNSNLDDEEVAAQLARVSTKHMNRKYGLKPLIESEVLRN